MSARCCLITGAGGGLGRVLARTFWAAGSSLLLAGESAAVLARQREELAPRRGQWARCLALDLGQRDAATEVSSWARKTAERLDVLINNAAGAPLPGRGWAPWRGALQSGFVAPAALCHALAPWMIEGGGGSIINLAGQGTGEAEPRSDAQASATAALMNLSGTLSQELAPHGVRVNCVAPAVRPVRTLPDGPGVRGPVEHVRVLAAGDSSAALANAAALCLFLASDGARGVTGRLLCAPWEPWRRLPGLAELADSGI